MTITWNDLLGSESALLLRLGELIFIWAKGEPAIKVIRVAPQKDPAELTEENVTIKVAMEIEVPDDLPVDDADAYALFCRRFVGLEGFALTEADAKLLTGDLSDYDDDADAAMEAILALDQRMRDWLARRDT